MESLLNLCWLLLALAALLAWCCQATSTPAGQRPRLVALLCALALMFPVISATDDLHPTVQAIEDSSKRTQKACAIKRVTSHVQHDTGLALPVATVTVVPQAHPIEWSRPTAAQNSPVGVTLLHFGRSPPVLTF